jgi:DNA-binding response OmpR family regulator
MLPGLDGYKICRMLKFDENFADITIIMVTSRSRSKDRETGFETGADLYITKPFDGEELLAAIRQFAGSKQKA